MTNRYSSASRLALAVAPAMLLMAGLAVAHPGHEAPTVHSHTGSPALLAGIAMSMLGVAALVGLTRFVVRRLRLRRQL